MEVVVAAIDLAAHPVALVGYIGLGVYAGRLWHAIKYGFLWGATLQLFAVALGRISILDVNTLASTTILRLLGAVLITVGVFYLARALSRPRPGGPASAA